MEQLQALSLAQKLILGGGILLLIVSFFNWQEVEISIGEFSASGGQSMWHGFWGVVLGLMVIALLAWAVARIAGVQLPENWPQGIVALVLGVLILAFAVIKNLVDDYSAWPSYVGIALAAVIAYGAWVNFQESGESMPELGRGPRVAGPAPETPAITPAPPETTDVPRNDA